jgi:hypothetical protein
MNVRILVRILEKQSVFRRTGIGKDNNEADNKWFGNVKIKVSISPGLCSMELVNYVPTVYAESIF